MDIKQYIASGILELYVLGRLEPAEVREVEANAAQYPEIRAEIEQIELSLEELAMAMAPEVNPDLLDRVLTDLPRQAPPPPAAQGASGNSPNAAVVKASRSSLAILLPWLLALAGLAGSLYFFTGKSELQASKQELQERYDALERDCQETETILLTAEQKIRSLANPATQSIILAGSDNHPDNGAIVFYNTATNKTFFSSTNLPTPPAGKQYQLWAIDGDGPKSLGVLALDLEVDEVIEVNYLPGIAAFAITLEDAGGKPAPDLSQLRVIGEVS